TLLGAQLPKLAGRHPEPVDRGPAEAADATQVSPGADDARVEHRGDGGREFGGDAPGSFGDEVTGGAQEGEWQQGEPVQRHGPRGGVDEAAVELRGADYAVPAGLGYAAATERLGAARACDAGGGDDDDTVTGESGADAEVE